MMTGVAVSFCVGLLVVVTLIFTWGNALDADADVPFIYLIHVATQNRAATTALVLLLATPLLGSVVACCATASRQVWAMARDNGFPCSGFISRVSRIEHHRADKY
jgi:choline transport protein